MYARALSADCWQGPKNETNLVSDPSWDDIESAIRDLDGNVHTIVGLQADGEAHLVIGGGSCGRYIVYATFDNVHFSALSSGQAVQSKVPLCIGGEIGDYKDNLIVDIASALCAARPFAESGQLGPALPWHVK
jgi:hypothetical protein